MASRATRAHVVVDSATGRILGRLRHAADDACDHDELLATFAAEGGEVPLLRDIDLQAEISGIRHRMDDHGVVVARPQLVLDVGCEALDGDGEDTVEIKILAVDGDGAVVDHRAPVQVTTTRGKLSAKRGLVDLDHGRALISLTSTRETVEQVRLAVVTLDGSLRPGTTTVRFD